MILLHFKVTFLCCHLAYLSISHDKKQSSIQFLFPHIDDGNRQEEEFVRGRCIKNKNPDDFWLNRNRDTFCCGPEVTPSQ